MTEEQMCIGDVALTWMYHLMAMRLLDIPDI